MLDTNLSSADKVLFEHDLVRDHQVYFRVHNMSLDHLDIRDISSRLIDGQVTVDAAAEINTRSLSITLMDPDATLGFDSGDPSDGVMFADRMLRVYYEVYSLSLSRWVSIVVFTGPVMSLDRTGALLVLEASGKEVLAREVWGNFTIVKGTLKSDAIGTILSKAGEVAKYRKLGKSTKKLGAVLSIAHPQTYWLAAKKVAQSATWQLYYNAYGIAVTRIKPVTSLYTFEGSGAVLSEPQITYNPDTLKNVIRVVGKKKAKSTPAYNAYAPPSHPLSAQSLIRGGKPGYMPERFQSDSYTSVAECKSHAVSILNGRLAEAIEVKFDSMVIPHLEPYDKCTLNTDKIGLTFELKTFTIPLTPEGVMTVGYVRKQGLTMALKDKIRRRIK